MQRPRRTSEFPEESGTASKRALRPRVSSAAPASASRPSASGSIGRRVTVTPQHGRYTATPQRGTTGAAGTHAAYTAEKRMNDKKWAQEQMHHIVEYLGQCECPEMNSLANELSGMRGGPHLTTKQFVTIINFFLSFVVGNRFKVSLSNHVDEIVNVMQRIDYPHQLNKSWLKTPNAQHSFCHVVILLDFLMEFAPPQSDVQMQTIIFPFDDIDAAKENTPKTALNSEGYEDEEFKMPDTEYQVIFLGHAEEGFRLWDRQKNEEFEGLQQQSTNVLIQKRCGAESSIALDAEIKRLQQQLKEIEVQRVRIPTKELERHRECEQKYNAVAEQLQAAEEQYIANEDELGQMKTQKQQVSHQVTTLKQDIVQMEKSIKSQTFTVAQRDKIILEIDQLRHILTRKVGSIRDLQSKSNHEEVIFSRAKKQFGTLVDKFNGCLRDIFYTVFNNTDSLDKYLLPQNPVQKDIQRLSTVLQRKRHTAMNAITQEEALLQQLQLQIAEMSAEIDTKLELESATLQKNIAAKSAAEMALLQHYKTSITRLDEEIFKFEQQLQRQRLEISSFNEHLQHQQVQIDDLKESNETMMLDAEREHSAYYDDREAYLNRYETDLNEANALLDAFESEFGKL